MMAINKKSQAHVEMIISLILFVGFSVFIFIYLDPFSWTDREVDITETRGRIFSNVSKEVGKLAVIVNTTNDCYEADKLGEYGSEFIEIPDPDNVRRYTLYFGDFFDSKFVNKVSCSNIEQKNFTFGSFNLEDVIVYQEIENFADRYRDNYPLLREDLGVKDFSFNVTDLDRKQLYYKKFSVPLGVVGKVPNGVNVISKDIPVRIMDDKAKFVEAVFQIRVWG